MINFVLEANSLIAKIKGYDWKILVKLFHSTLASSKLVSFSPSHRLTLQSRWMINEFPEILRSKIPHSLKAL